MLVAGSMLVGSVFAQTAAPATNALTKAAAAAPAAASAVKSVAAEVKSVVAPAPAASIAAPAAPAAAPIAAPAAAPAPAAPAKPAAAQPAAGGGAGKVWVNGKVYHCEGTKFYGKTKKGAYMTEADAKAKGAHVGKGQVCK
ncbi:signal peptide protein [uncultured Sphaerotilus sp.]|uniref:signal peptide protein n=1 Tax=uncultured Sphaerotilus sp. TaxID=474984 RepID=UPI0030CA2AB1